MNKLLFFALLGLAAAAHQATQASDTTAGGDKAEESDNSYGYEAPQQATYEPAAAYTPPAVDTCYTGQCDEHARCYNFATGTCVPQTGGYAHEGFEVAQQAGGYGRKLQYGAPEGYEGYAPQVVLGCPPGTVDTHHWRVHGRTTLWIGFGFLVVPGLCFLWKSFDAVQNNGSKSQKALAEEVTKLRMSVGFVCMVAALAYLAMATKHGYTTLCSGRDFYYARYVDWIITTPLMLLDLCIISGTASYNTKVFLVAMDVLMIVAGLMGSLIEGGERWAFFGFGMLCFIPILYFLFTLANQPGNQHMNCCQGLFGAGKTTRQRVYSRAMTITVLTWIVYPIIWICAEVDNNNNNGGAYGGYGAVAAAGPTGMGVISVNGESIAYTVLDIIAKSVFGWIIVFTAWEAEECCGHGSAHPAPTKPTKPQKK